MGVVTKHLEFETNGNAGIVDITPSIEEWLRETSLRDGAVVVFVPGATGAVTTVEYEPGLVKDLGELWEKIAPSGRTYHHDRAWGDGNGHSHVRASLVGPSLTIPFIDGALTLGTWQQAVFIDFDVRARRRKLVLQFMGE
jgi:secondary thiamine-phosphate synthase enzyme